MICCFLSDVLVGLKRKLEVNCESGQNKSRQSIYKDIPVSIEQTIQQRQFEVLEKPNLRIYCSECELELTRQAYIITKTDYYCVKCFSNLEEYPQEYLTRRTLRLSFTNSCWDLMDEVVMMTAFKIWGYGNWGQIKEYLDYNLSPFLLKEVQEHFEKYYLKEPYYIPPFEQPIPAKPKKTFTDMNLQFYSSIWNTKLSQIRRKDSKGEKKLLSSMKSISLFSSSREIQAYKSEQQQQNNNNQNAKVDNLSVNQARIKNQKQRHNEKSFDRNTELQRQRQKQRQREKQQKTKEKKNQCSILGYNMKRKQFQFGQYDYSAQSMLADLQFYDDDSEQQFKIKLQIIQAYNRRLQQRIRRRQFVLEYKLLDTSYQFNQTCSKNEKESIAFLQNFMRFTNNHEEYLQLIDSHSQERKYKNFLANLTKIRRKVADNGTINEAHTFMKEKRKEYIKRWEKTFNRTYNDKNRGFWTKKIVEGEQKFFNEKGEQENLDLPTNTKDLLMKSLENKNQIIRVDSLKVKAIYVPNSEEQQEKKIVEKS